jgi:hypothetical protein
MDLTGVDDFDPADLARIPVSRGGMLE